MNCIIVGDRNSGNLFQEFVAKYNSLNLVGTFNDSISFRAQLSQNQDIDLVLLDIDMYGMESLGFIVSLDYKPNIIVLSSSDQYAMKAFDIGVVDYLLKPVTYSRFCKAVDKSIKYRSRMELNNSANNEIFIKKGASLVKLKLNDLIFIEALENYVTLNTNNEKFTLHFTMKALENQLPSDIFIRVHRSFIVNKSNIKTIQENSLDLLVGDTYKIFPVGKSFRSYLMNNINVMAR